MAPHDRGKPETGRASAIAQLLRDPFNCLGPYSDAAPRDCHELRFIATDDAHMEGAFKTPGLRNVAARSLHAFGPDRHAVRRGEALRGGAQSGHKPQRKAADGLVGTRNCGPGLGFLNTLSSPIREGN
ncbi:hypothetical protein LP420_06130 [Massilia sp. B-10]|nr:hypothetical protein LP420_06130 [Massilia sp. B-10]